MPTYKIRPGARLAHHGGVLVAGEMIELPLRVAEHPDVAAYLEAPDTVHLPPVVAVPELGAPPAVSEPLFRYKVREGKMLPHLGGTVVAGSIVELTAEVGGHPNVSHYVDLIGPVEVPPVKSKAADRPSTPITKASESSQG